MGSEYINYGKSKGLDLENCSSEKLLYENRKYDLIILNHVLEHFVDIKKELSIIRNLLSDDGVFYIGVPGVKNIHASYLDILNYLQNAHVRHFSKDTLTQLMGWNGFQLISANEKVQALYKKGEFQSEVNNYSKDIINYLRNLESARKNHKIITYLEDKGTKSLAIYGFGKIGKYVYKEISSSKKLKVCYLVDRRNIKVDNISVYKPSKNLPPVDIVLIATAGDYENIIKTIGDNNSIITYSDMMQDILSGNY